MGSQCSYDGIFYPRNVIPVSAIILHRAMHDARNNMIPSDSLLSDKFFIHKHGGTKRMLLEHAVMNHGKRNLQSELGILQTTIHESKASVYNRFLDYQKLLQTDPNLILEACVHYLVKTAVEINETSPGTAIYEHPGYPNKLRSDVVQEIWNASTNVRSLVDAFLKNFTECTAYVYVRNSIDDLEKVSLDYNHKFADIVHRRLQEYSEKDLKYRYFVHTYCINNESHWKYANRKSINSSASH